MGDLAAQEERLGKASGVTGAEQKKAIASTQKLESKALKEKSVAAKKLEADRAKQDKAAAHDVSEKIKAARTAEKERKSAAHESKKSFIETKKLLSGDVGSLLEAGGAAGAIQLALVGVTAAAIAATIAVGGLAYKANEAKENAKAILSVLSNGRGDKLLENVDKLAVQLGQDIGDTRDRFIEFRRAGLGNEQSAKLIALRADLLTVDKSGTLAAEAVKKVLTFTSANGRQTEEQLKAANAEMLRLAKGPPGGKQRVPGNGSLSAAAAKTTLTGALNRIGNANPLEAIGEKIAPSIDKAASAVADMVEQLVNSKEGKRAIDELTNSIVRLAQAAEKGAPKIKQLVDSGIIGETTSIVSDVVSTVWGAVKEVGSALYEIPYAFYRTGKDILTIGSGVLDAINWIGGKGNAAIDATVAYFEDAGGNMIRGLVKGIEAEAGAAVDEIKALADKLSFGFAKKLEMRSPSKRFERHGENIGKGVGIGTAKTMPSGKDVAARILPPNVIPINRAAQAQAQAAQPLVNVEAGAGSTGNTTYEVHVHLHGASTTEETVRAVRRELDIYFAGKALQDGRRVA